ncbi:hypothetical protein [Brachybacterium sp. GPGPB12]|uniref:hypothetical protein n=1 Tax=Brachybacterium sp. GPGPB12 TaxID=3023517 RepID=UPI0031345892
MNGTDTASEARPVPSPRGGRIARSVRGAGIILIVTVFARIAGFVRYLVFGASVGAGDVGTAYTTANMLPNVLFEIVAGGALAAAVVPLIAGLVPERDPEEAEGTADVPVPAPAAGTTAVPRPSTATPEPTTPAPGSLASPQSASSPDSPTRPVPAGAALADRIVSAPLTWTVIGTLLLAALVIALAEPLSQPLLASDQTGAAGVGLGATPLRIFAVQSPFYGVSVVLAAYLQARRRFLWPAMMPLLSSLVVMASYRVYALLVPSVATVSTIEGAAVQWLGWGTTAGVVVMARPSRSPPPGRGARPPLADHARRARTARPRPRRSGARRGRRPADRARPGDLAGHARGRRRHPARLPVRPGALPARPTRCWWCRW